MSGAIALPITSNPDDAIASLIDFVASQIALLRGSSPFASA
jgi:hypothetical protein